MQISAKIFLFAFFCRFIRTHSIVKMQNLHLKSQCFMQRDNNTTHWILNTGNTHIYKQKFLFTYSEKCKDTKSIRKRMHFANEIENGCEWNRWWERRRWWYFFLCISKGKSEMSCKIKINSKNKLNSQNTTTISKCKTEWRKRDLMTNFNFKCWFLILLFSLCLSFSSSLCSSAVCSGSTFRLMVPHFFLNA